MARRRDDDEDEDRDDEDRPRKRRRDREDDYDDEDDDDRRRRKRRSDDDDDFDDRPARKKQLSGLDAMYHDTSIVILILFGCLCGWIAVILSVIALVTGKDETAKRNATIVLIVAFVVGVMHGVGIFMRTAGRHM